MNFYKSSEFVFFNLDLVKKISKIRGDWYVFFAGEDSGTLITDFDVFELKKFLFAESKEKEVKKVSLVCDRCKKTFMLNVLFDKNGVSVNPITRLCPDCSIEVKK